MTMYCSHQWIIAYLFLQPVTSEHNLNLRWNTVSYKTHYWCWELVIYFHWDIALAHKTQNSVWTIITHSWRHKLTVKHYCSGSLDWNVYNFYFWQNLKQKLTEGTKHSVGFRDSNPPKVNLNISQNTMVWKFTVSMPLISERKFYGQQLLHTDRTFNYCTSHNNMWIFNQQKLPNGWYLTI